MLQNVTSMTKMGEYLAPTYFIDCNSNSITDKARELTSGVEQELERAVKLFYFVRDEVKYNPYLFSPNAENYVASIILSQAEGYCVQKAVLLAALARAMNIPSRLGFADIKNWLVSEKLSRIMGTNLFVYHGYTELFLEHKWIKATPAFDLKMCLENDIVPVEFDGRKDAVFHKHNNRGELHIEYVQHHGSYADLPLKQMLDYSLSFYSPNLFPS